MLFADANIIVRYIINDDETMAARAEAAVNEGSLAVLSEVFAEVVYVLAKVYGIGRADVANSMQELLGFVSTPFPAVMRSASDFYRESGLDFVDCVLAAHSISGGKEILSFDKKLNAFIARKKAGRTV